MKTLAVAVTLFMLLVPCLVFAQDKGAPADTSWRIRAGWFDMGDADNGLGIGVDYKFRLWNQKWMAGIEWGDGEGEAAHPVAAVAGNSISLDVWDINFNWIGEVATEKYKWYYGAGIGWYDVRWSGDSDDSFGFQVLAGVDFAKNWSLDVRYVFGTDFNDADIDGVRVSLGYAFGGK
jgi:opacity protein-like surface antigen